MTEPREISGLWELKFDSEGHVYRVDPGERAREMKPGPELDALVAEKVMGWVRGGGRMTWIRQGPFANCDCPSHDEAATVALYSTSISDAFEVVEKLYALSKRGFMCNWLADFAYQGAWIASFYSMDPDTGDSDAEADTLPHAICLAALRAVGEEV